MTPRVESPDVWVGIKRCGCVVAVVVDEPGHPKDTEQSKHEFLSQGLSVVHATWAEWNAKYHPLLLNDCVHQPAAAGQRSNARDGEEEEAQD